MVKRHQSATPSLGTSQPCTEAPLRDSSGFEERGVARVRGIETRPELNGSTVTVKKVRDDYCVVVLSPAFEGTRLVRMLKKNLVPVREIPRTPMPVKMETRALPV